MSTDGLTRAERAQAVFRALDADGNGVANELRVNSTSAENLRRGVAESRSGGRSFTERQFVDLFQDAFESEDASVARLVSRVESAREDVDTIRNRAPATETAAPRTDNSALLTTLVGTGGIGGITAAVVPLIEVSVVAAVAVGIGMALVFIAVLIYLIVSAARQNAPAAPQNQVPLAAARTSLASRVDELLRSYLRPAPQRTPDVTSPPPSAASVS